MTYVPKSDQEISKAVQERLGQIETLLASDTQASSKALLLIAEIVLDTQERVKGIEEHLSAGVKPILPATVR